MTEMGGAERETARGEETAALRSWQRLPADVCWGRREGEGEGERKRERESIVGAERWGAGGSGFPRTRGVVGVTDGVQGAAVACSFVFQLNAAFPKLCTRKRSAVRAVVRRCVCVCFDTRVCARLRKVRSGRE